MMIKTNKQIMKEYDEFDEEEKRDAEKALKIIEKIKVVLSLYKQLKQMREKGIWNRIKSHHLYLRADSEGHNAFKSAIEWCSIYHEEKSMTTILLIALEARYDAIVKYLTTKKCKPICIIPQSIKEAES